MTDDPRNQPTGPVAAPARDPDPRGPDAPDKQRQGDERGAQSSTRSVLRAFEELTAVAPPPVRWVGTNYNYDAGNGGRVGIVIHTEVGTNASATGRFQQPNQASAHYGVAYDGHEVVQWVAEQNTAWHCGRYYAAAGYPVANWTAIGIEHEDNGAYNSPRPDGLYETSARLVAWICERYGIPCDRSHIRKHSEVSVVGTACPDALDIDRIVARAQQLLSPPVDPAWKKALSPEAFTVTLTGPVPLYDLTTGGAAGSVGGAGAPFTAAYRGTINGVDYRVTQYSFDHGTARGVKTSDVQPVEEWQKNLQPDPYSVTMDHDFYWYDISDAKAGTAGGTIKAGPFASAYKTTVKGTDYRVTQYSADRKLPHGVKASDVVVVPPEPEWHKNATPNHRTFTLTKAIPVVDLVTGADTPASVPAGSLVTDYDTSVGATKYYQTMYSFTRNLAHGVRVSDVDAAVDKPPGPGPDGPPTPDPTNPNFFEVFLRWLSQYLKKIFP